MERTSLIMNSCKAREILTNATGGSVRLLNSPMERITISSLQSFHTFRASSKAPPIRVSSGKGLQAGLVLHVDLVPGRRRSAVHRKALARLPEVAVPDATDSVLLRMGLVPRPIISARLRAGAGRLAMDQDLDRINLDRARSGSDPVAKARVLIAKDRSVLKEDRVPLERDPAPGADPKLFKTDPLLDAKVRDGSRKGMDSTGKGRVVLTKGPDPFGKDVGPRVEDPDVFRKKGDLLANDQDRNAMGLSLAAKGPGRRITTTVTFGRRRVSDRATTGRSMPFLRRRTGAESCRKMETRRPRSFTCLRHGTWLWNGTANKK
jgi:hypothetical protein